MFALRLCRHMSTSIKPGGGRVTAKVTQFAGIPDPRSHTNPNLWRNLTFLVALPAVGACMVNAYLGEKEHWAHPEHARPKFVAYEYMRRRTKPFPWGDGNHSLLHNPMKNALPDGYETELPGEHDEHH
ncbi:cytochrome c oxidase subunit 6A1, mitochondrial-like [Paramacrobiotus metropolitanus]|uniref:cytochrome c oxidase subunit 6A1, mitochondrial-like n=1 Tax=Paramacrobiotus metropolitanus TaxID=2943436 RepID=UPI00244628A4|nr:cytochrome c oxidase subunit 6A1, mitochondrial-like [Paramacrobiotus metropolitanus]